VSGEVVLTNSITKSIKKEDVEGLTDRAKSGDVRTRGIRCWTTYQGWVAKLGVWPYKEQFEWWQGADWCGDGYTVTYFKTTDRGGKPLMGGWRYIGAYDFGRVNDGFRFHRWMRHKFKFGAGGWDLREEIVCSQIRVRGSGAFAVLASCKPRY
jgi:hypothetical protein